MGKPTGFLEIERHERAYDKVGERLKTWKEFVQPLPTPKVAEQAARCMDCGIPFCHQGCPVNNQIPDFNNLVYRDQWKAALENLQSTNNFPEFTGRVCPAPCEASCTLNIDDNPGGPSRRATARSATEAGMRAGSRRRCRRAGPASGSRWWGLAPRAWPAPSNSPARRPRADRLREVRPDRRRPAPLRHPRLQDGKSL